MASLNELKKYLGYEFSSGPYTGNDYRSFQTKYINYLKNLCNQNGWDLVNIGRKHYCFSAFIRNKDYKHIYLDIPDVRYWPNLWYKQILIRRSASETDYTGSRNNYIDLPGLRTALIRMFKFYE